MNVSLNFQAYSSDEEEMLIVVLDDDDELVIGKSNHNVPTPSATQQQHSRRGSTPQRYANNNNNQRNSPCRTANKSSKYKQRNSQSSGRTEQKCDTPSTNSSRNQRERPVINTQKLAQRLQNIKQDQDRRAKSPRKEKTTPEKSSSDSCTMKLSHSEPQFNIPLERPHARIAKPVERKKKKKRTRPDPEGAPLDPAEMDELDKILCSNELLFSDYGSEEESSEKSDVAPKRSNRSGFSIAAFAIGLGLNSNTMIKYAIISTELQNIIRVSLKMVCHYTDPFSQLLNWFLVNLQI